MKAILINAEARTVEEVTIETKPNGDTDINDMYKKIGCDTFCGAPVQGRPEFGMNVGQHYMYVDDNGLLKQAGDTIFAFRFEGCVGPISGGYAGNGLIVGCDGEGGDADYTLDLKALQKTTGFTSVVSTGG